jgi:hypothetical protein
VTLETKSPMKQKEAGSISKSLEIPKNTRRKEVTKFLKINK